MTTVSAADPQPVIHFPMFDANGNITEYVATNGVSGSALKIRNRLEEIGRLSGVESLRPQDPSWQNYLWFSNGYGYVPGTDLSSGIEGCATGSLCLRAFAIRPRGWRENAETQRR